MTDTNAITLPQLQPARASMQDAQADAEAEHTQHEIYDKHTVDVHKKAPPSRHPTPSQAAGEDGIGPPSSL